MKKVVITGASGFIGGELSKRLLQNGATVWGVGRNRNRLQALAQYGDFRPVVAEFEDYGKLDELIPERGFDWFYHFAWQGLCSGDRNDYDVQLGSLKATCDAACSAAKLKCGCNCCCSTVQEADVALPSLVNGPYSPFNPIYYGIVHRTAAELFKAIMFRHGMSCVNLIFPNIYGVNDRAYSAVMLFVRNLMQHKPMDLVSGDYAYDWMPVEDLVDGIIAASKSELTYGDYYIGHRHITTFKEKLTEMKRLLNSDSELNYGTYPENHYVDYSRFDLDALYRDTGWEAKTSFADSIIQVADWYQSTLKGENESSSQ